MGYLKDVGNTLSYPESKKHIEGVKRDGIIQFLNLLKKFKDNESTGTLWGDELEYHLVNIDPETGKVRIKLAAAEVIQRIKNNAFEAQFEAQFEYGKWMIEAVPKNPYDIVCDPEPVFESITQRRKGIQKYLDPNDHILPTPVFTMLGVGDYYISNEQRERSLERQKAKSDSASAFDGEEEKITFNQKTEKTTCMTPKEKAVRNEISHSRYVDDEIINDHPRFPTLTRNLRLRRGETMNIKIPIYKDIDTEKDATEDEPYPGFIHMDATAFGMGNGCLQQTFAAKDLSNARYLTDQLAVIAPIMLALSAGAPIFKGKLADTDTRWSSIAQSVDDRTAEERDPSSERYIPKSRYDSISYYISELPAMKNEYNDVKFPINTKAMKFAEEQAKELGIDIDDRLLNHLGFLFLRDPMIIFKEKIHVENDSETNHFENFQSTNWNSVRFKPPPAFDSKIGWRVELRTAELQIKDIENASLDLLALLIVRMIQRFNLNFYIPMSKLNENFERASKQNAVTSQKFWFRKRNEYESADEYVELTIAEFINGKEQVYKGLMGWAREFYNNYCKCHEDPFSRLVENFLSKIIDRAEGKAPTNAQWIRSFVMKHPAYKKDSVVSEEISKDLISAILEISREEKDYSDFV